MKEPGRPQGSPLPYYGVTALEVLDFAGLLEYDSTAW